MTSNDFNNASIVLIQMILIIPSSFYHYNYYKKIIEARNYVQTSFLIPLNIVTKRYLNQQTNTCSKLGIKTLA